MAIISRRIKVNDHIELSTFYTLDSAHDVVCIDFKSLDGSSKGHFSTHHQLSRVAVQELINALTDTLTGVGIDPPFPGDADYKLTEQEWEDSKNE